MREVCVQCGFWVLARMPFCVIMDIGVAFVQPFLLLGPGDGRLGVKVA